MSTIKANQWLNPDGTENYKCRAWVNFNGTGTVAIRASGNVSSITDNGVGDYTVNFTTAMPDVNYAPSFSGKVADDAGVGYAVAGVYRAASAMLTTSVRFNLLNSSFGAYDYLVCTAVIFR
jgi:hypothetical protein